MNLLQSSRSEDEVPERVEIGATLEDDGGAVPLHLRVLQPELLQGLADRKSDVGRAQVGANGVVKILLQMKKLEGKKRGTRVNQLSMSHHFLKLLFTL